jgi:hypothetical protein
LFTKQNNVKYIFYFFFFIPVFSSAQHLRKIIDSATGAPISFATVKVLNQPRGVIASENGVFDLHLDPADSILISSVGFQEKIITAKEIKDSILLSPKFKTLAEITVKDKKYLRTVYLGKGVPVLHEKIVCKDNDCWNWGPTEIHEEFAEKIVLPFPDLTYQLRKIFLPVKQVNCWGPLLLHVYIERKGSEFPGEEIFIKPVSFTRSQVHNNFAEIDLSAEEIYFENNRQFFISVGWIPGASKEKCLTTILLHLSKEDADTYSRSLLSNKYQWQKIGYVEGKKHDLHLRPGCFYAVELWERK